MADTKFLQKVYDLLNGVITAGAVNVNAASATTKLLTLMNGITVSALGGATHTGIDVEGYDKFSLLLTTNKNCAVFIQDSDDNSTWYTLADKTWCDKIGWQVNNNAGIIAETITPITKTNDILIHNTDLVDTILVSFDSGTTYKTIPPEHSLDANINIVSFLIKGSAAAVSYEILASIFSDYVNIKVNPDVLYSTTNASFEFKSVRKYMRMIVYNLDVTEATVSAKLYCKI